MSGWRTLIATSWMPRCHFDAGDDDDDDDVDNYLGGIHPKYLRNEYL